MDLELRRKKKCKVPHAAYDIYHSTLSDPASALQAPVNSHSAAPTSSEERPTSMTKQVHDISDKLGELIESGEPDGLSRWPNQRREVSSAKFYIECST